MWQITSEKATNLPVANNLMDKFFSNGMHLRKLQQVPFFFPFSNSDLYNSSIALLYNVIYLIL